jgi:hypothetical protein
VHGSAKQLIILCLQAIAIVIYNKIKRIFVIKSRERNVAVVLIAVPVPRFEP